MTKNKFLKELDKSLYVLAESERKDIINEYRDIIEEKMKHGKTEKEAVEEFGSMDQLVREILSAYKVNPNYNNKEDDFKESAKKLGNDFDSFVKKGAIKATEFTKEVVEEIKQKNEDITIEFVFELLFKAFATLIIMFIATIPFFIIRQIGNSILNMAIYPINKILLVLWSLLVTILFIGCCFLIFIAMFKQYFKSDKKKVNKEIKEKQDEKVERKEEGKEKKVITKKEQKVTPLLDIFLAIAKAVIVMMMIPLIFFNISLIIGLIITIYLLLKGIMIPGVLIGMIGLVIFFGYLQKMLFDIIFNHKKIHFYPYVIGIILGIIGGVICFDQVMNLSYYDEAPKHHLEEITNVESMVITTDFVEFESWNPHYQIKIEENPTLKDNEIKIITNHYQGFIDNVKTEQSDNYTNDENKTVVSYTFVSDETNLLSKENKDVWKLVIDNFNEKKIYNYDKLNDIEITIEANVQTSKKLIVNSY